MFHQLMKVTDITHILIINKIMGIKYKQLMRQHMNIYTQTRLKVVQTNTSSEIYTMLRSNILMHCYISNPPRKY